MYRRPPGQDIVRQAVRADRGQHVKGMGQNGNSAARKPLPRIHKTPCREAACLVLGLYEFAGKYASHRDPVVYDYRHMTLCSTSHYLADVLKTRRVDAVSALSTPVLPSVIVSIPHLNGWDILECKCVLVGYI